MDSLKWRLKHVIAQLLSADSSSINSETSFGSLLGEEGLRSVVVQRAFGLLCCMVSRSKLMEDIDHTLQELHLLALDIDLSEELQTLAEIEQQLCTILHLPSVEKTSASLIIIGLGVDLITQSLQTKELFSTPEPDLLPAHCVTGMDDRNELLVVFIYSSLLRALSYSPAKEVVGRRLGQCLGETLQTVMEGISDGKSRAGFSCDMRFKDLKEYDVAAASAEGSRLRTEFLEEAQLKPPKVLRVIDCQATCIHGQVVLRDWRDCAQEVGYSAISHTYGQDIYTVFDCRCATICEAQVPRCSFAPCPHDPAGAGPDHAENATQNRAIIDILNMCAILRAAGVDYAWHDGVCIAQHDDAEVKHTIEHIGWIYASAKETIIFLHYVGEPIAPLFTYDDRVRSPRWQTRVWTLQEAALSRCRRYCVRVGLTPIGDCDSVEELERKVALWYDDEFSKIEVIEEERFFEILRATSFSLQSLELKLRSVGGFSWDALPKLGVWAGCINGLIDTLRTSCLSFPTIDQAIQMCTERESKHRGDRINSILTLAKIKGFVAEKDNNVEASTIEFFARQGQVGLAKVLYSTITGTVPMNRGRDGKGSMEVEVRTHTWLPSLSSSFHSFYVPGLEDLIRCRVLGDGKLEVRGKLVCIKVKFTVRVKAKTLNANMDNGDGAIDATTGGNSWQPRFDTCAYRRHILSVVPTLWFL